MAMDAGSKNDEPITAINVTPLVDVCLVLVIIFMAVAPMAVTVGINVLESRAKTAEGKASVDDNVTVKLTADGKLTINGAEVPEATLSQALQQALGKSKDKLVVVTADDANRVGQVVGILDMARQVGAMKLAVMKADRS
jgi:biopolymer transport protein TolR